MISHVKFRVFGYHPHPHEIRGTARDSWQLRQGLTSNLITYSALISACEKGQELERAVHAFQSMCQQGLVPDIIVYWLAEPKYAVYWQPLSPI